MVSYKEDNLSYNQEIIAGLQALFHATGGSVRAHVPLERIRKKFQSPYKGMAKSIIENLVRKGYAYRKKGRSTSYGVTKSGIYYLKKIGLITT
jgi:hypothetical protein